MTTAYLDTNIFVYLEKETLTIEDLLNIVPSNIDEIYYSSAHIQELIETKGENKEQKTDRINSRLKVIEDISVCNYLYHELPSNKVFKIKEKPDSVLKTLLEMPAANPIMKNMMNLINEDQRKEFREQLGLEISKLNNYKPNEVIAHLNKKLGSLGENLSFIELIEKGISFHPQGAGFGLHNRIAGIFELLDMLGYWTDKYTQKSNYARLWDSNHTYFASFCDYFISDDKRTRNKAKVVYDMYSINSIIISSKGQ